MRCPLDGSSRVRLVGLAEPDEKKVETDNVLPNDDWDSQSEDDVPVRAPNTNDDGSEDEAVVRAVMAATAPRRSARTVNIPRKLS